jgi:hypothetical protein
VPDIGGVAYAYRVLTLYDPGNMTPRYLVLGAGPGLAMALNAAEDLVVGNPSPPSLKVRQNVRFGPVRWPIVVGTNTFKLDCLYTPDDGVGTRPQVVAKANAAVGLLADLTAEIAAGANAWHTSPALSFVATAAGGVEVFLVTRNPRPDGVGTAGSPFVTANWDNIVRTTPS